MPKKPNSNMFFQGRSVDFLLALDNGMKVKTISNIKKELKVVYTTALLKVHQLEKDGLAERVRKDKRSFQFQLTDKGKQLASYIKSIKIILDKN